MMIRVSDSNTLVMEVSSSAIWDDRAPNTTYAKVVCVCVCVCLIAKRGSRKKKNKKKNICVYVLRTK